MALGYSIEEVNKYIDELTDKMGSDFFPLPIKFGRFITVTYDIIRESTIALQLNQEITDDIMPLVVRRTNALIPVNNSPGSFQMPVPIDYHRLISLYPFARIGGVNTRLAKKVSIFKEGQRLAYNRDPHRKPTPSYPSVTRLENFFQIDTNDVVNQYLQGELAYVKKPTFGNINVITDRIVNLPDLTIEMICLKTADSLRFTTSDESSADIYMFNQTFGKRNK